LIYLILFVEFIKIGLFAVGGGMATLPFLYELSERLNWFSREDIANMLAISESTPGPIGINMATYVGFNIGGLLGSVVATLSVSIPGIVIALVVYIFMEKFKESPVIESAFYGIRPVVAALVSIAFIEILKTCVIAYDPSLSAVNITELVNLKAAAVFIAFVILLNRLKWHPIVYISGGAILGIVISW